MQVGGQPVLRGVDLAIPPGQLVALIGPNGSGKTTLLRAILGLQPRLAGEIRLFGQDNLAAALPRVGYVPQRLNIERSFILTVREFLSLRLEATRHWFWHLHGKSDRLIRESLSEIGVEALWEKPLATLSGGQLQRVMIAFSLLRQPDLLLLDEPTAGMNRSEAQTLMALFKDLIGKYVKAILLIEHNMRVVMGISDRVHVLDYGEKISEGHPDEVRRDPRVIEAYLGQGSWVENAQS